MHVQYNQQIDEITSDEMRPDLYYQNTLGPEQKFPTVIGIVEIISGFITALLGALEVLIIPMTDNIHGSDIIKLDKSNCFGTGFIAGIMMILTGSTAIRASISKRATTVYRFYNLTMLTMLIYVGITIFLITAYGLGWTTKNNYPPNSHVHEVHMLLSVSMILGLMFVTSALVKYYNVVFCGEMQLGYKWLRCLFGCCCSGRLFPRSLSTMSAQGYQIERLPN